MSRSKWPEANRGYCSKDFSFQDMACMLHRLQNCPSDALQSAICEPMTLSPVHCLSYVGLLLQVLTPAYREHHTTLPYWGALTCSSNHHTLETFKVTPILMPTISPASSAPTSQSDSSSACSSTAATDIKANVIHFTRCGWLVYMRQRK